jgi:hypothetical protein
MYSCWSVCALCVLTVLTTCLVFSGRVRASACSPRGHRGRPSGSRPKSSPQDPSNTQPSHNDQRRVHRHTPYIITQSTADTGSSERPSQLAVASVSLCVCAMLSSVGLGACGSSPGLRLVPCRRVEAAHRHTTETHIPRLQGQTIISYFHHDHIPPHHSAHH